MNQVMFAGTDALPSARKLNRIADSAVDVFLAAYGKEQQPRDGQRRRTPARRSLGAN